MDNIFRYSVWVILGGLVSIVEMEPIYAFLGWMVALLDSIDDKVRVIGKKYE